MSKAYWALIILWANKLLKKTLGGELCTPPPRTRHLNSCFRSRRDFECPLYSKC